MEKAASQPFILASVSPRRKELLTKAGFRFEVIPSDVDESVYDTDNITSAEHTKQLALAKARDVAVRYPSRLVLGADTMVDFQGQIIGKPNDADHAREITMMLFSQPHKVITGVAFVGIDDGIEVVEAETTIVYPKPLSKEQIDEHIKNVDWQGKAGAYGIQQSGDEFVERIDGSFTNVIGLPMELVEKILRTLPA